MDTEDPRIVRARQTQRGLVDSGILEGVVEAYDDQTAELAKARRACQTLGRTVEAQCQAALDAIGERLGGDIIDETGDGDWGLVWERLAELGKGES